MQVGVDVAPGWKVVAIGLDAMQVEIRGIYC